MICRKIVYIQCDEVNVFNLNHIKSIEATRAAKVSKNKIRSLQQAPGLQKFATINEWISTKIEVRKTFNLYHSCTFCMQKLSNKPTTKMYSFLLFSFNIKCTPDCTMKRRTEHRIDRYTYNKIYCSLFFHLVKYTQNCYMKAHMHTHTCTHIHTHILFV